MEPEEWGDLESLRIGYGRHEVCGWKRGLKTGESERAFWGGYLSEIYESLVFACLLEGKKASLPC